MTRMLILDDLQIRHEGFRKILSKHELHHASTVAQAKLIVETQSQKGEPIECVCLDHDLGKDPTVLDFAHYLKTGEERFLEPTEDGHDEYRTLEWNGPTAPVYLSGADFARWLAKRTDTPKRFIIHTHNHPGAMAIAEALREIEGSTVLVKRFSA